MAEPTEADREKALQALGYPRGRANTFATVEYVRVHAIAQALADERERARAPFLRLADDHDAIWQESTATDPVDVLIAGTFRASANDIRRRAAEETGQ